MDKIYYFYNQKKFTIIDNVLDDYKCGICTNVLINAHQGECACNFCYNCIDQCKANGIINCPSNIDGCSSVKLSSFIPNYIFNKIISKLIVKCSTDMCLHTCQLSEIENHLNSCLKKEIKCIFNDVGCKCDNISNDKSNDHMLSYIFYHNKILINLIGNIKNKMVELEEKLEKYRIETEMLNVEINSIKKENENLKQKIISNEVDNECKKIELLKQFDEKYIKQVIADLNEKLKEKIKEDNEKYVQMNNEINQINKYLSMRDNGELVWQICPINQIIEMFSDCFYDKQNPYKMCLQMQNIDNELNIWLRVHKDGVFNDDVKWPCKIKVVIIISACNNANNCITKTNCSEIKKSIGMAELIKCSHNELRNLNLFTTICKVWCKVNID